MTRHPDGERLPDVRVAPPGPASRELAARLGAVESPNVTWTSPDFPVFWTSARGSNVWDADGNRYVDLTAAFGVAAVGHRHPRVEAAVREQASRLLHGMGDVHPPAEKVTLLERLGEVMPVPDPRIVLGVSGAEAVEIALKTARLYTGRPGVVSFRGAYHGLTYGALAVTDRDLFRSPFEDQLNPHVRWLPYPDPYRPPGGLAEAEDMGAAVVERLDDLLGREGHRIGAVVLEPVQGRAGTVVPPRGFLAGVARVCRRHGALLVADEIFTGLGRTGRRLACDHEGVTPDLVCVGKALSSSLPVSACVGRAEVMGAWPPSRGEAIHTSTFMANPLACAAAVASLDVLLEEELTERAAREGDRWRDDLASMARRHPAVGDVRGRGLMLGLDLVRDPTSRRPDPELARRVILEALRRGWILLASGRRGNVLSLSPPLTVARHLLDAATGLMDELLAAATASRG